MEENKCPRGKMAGHLLKEDPADMANWRDDEIRERSAVLQRKDRSFCSKHVLPPAAIAPLNQLQLFQYI